MANQENATEWWQALLTGNIRRMPIRQVRRLFSLLPAHARCKFCNSPFVGRWAPLMRLVGHGPSRLTSEFCNYCQVVATEHLGGAEIDLTVLFADVRGSTQLGERMSPAEFSQLISRFFAVSSHILLDSRAWVDKLVGDQVIGIYLHYFTGPQPEQVALRAAQALLRATGHGEPGGPWIEVGVGVHSGTTFIGAVGSHDGATDITVLGDVPNVAARLSSAAHSGEILVVGATLAKASWPLDGETRLLELKGKSQPLTVHVLNQYTAPRLM